jgi:radical SAM protein with 4Fe4S-binding SPASM domain
VLAAKEGAHEFRILEPIPTGRFAGEKKEVLNAHESRQLADFHKNWNVKGKGPAIACFAHLESDAMFGCGAGFHHLFIDALGNVCPCDLTPLKMGNCLEEPLHDIWTRMSEWFDLPRCGCFMKQLCASEAFENISEFPLCREKSEDLCRRFGRGDERPEIFARLLKDRKPTNPPAPRP